jgi:hypothetical protein
MTIIAKDPELKADERIITTQVQIPYELLDDGPRGYRVHVIDYDSSRKVLYKPASLDGDDRFKDASDEVLASDPAFHAQNVYATAMRQLARFEFALGRRVSWGFGGHQIYACPHAFADENAYYSSDDRGLLFGYFKDDEGKDIFTCLSHDIVAHEATHALLDGLRKSYTLPSSPDQAAFHEGLADIVALLSVFSAREVVKRLLVGPKADVETISRDQVTPGALRISALSGLAAQFAKATTSGRDEVLRNGAEDEPDRDAYKSAAFDECHLRSEILSGAVMRAFIDVWCARLGGWIDLVPGESVPVEKVVEDGSDAAEHLLTMCIRALDYCPVVDVQFGDFLSALLTADYEILPEDGKYKYRDALRKCFGQWGIGPASTFLTAKRAGDAIAEPGIWAAPPEAEKLVRDGVHREYLERDADEVFRFIWENRKALGIYEDAYTHVLSVRPCVRVGPDGFVLRETVSEYIQMLEVSAGELGGETLRIAKPEGMPDETPVRLNGGGVLVFDEFGRLKYHVRSRINNADKQAKRLKYLWDNGVRDSQGRYGFTDGAPRGTRFAMIHLQRSGQLPHGGEWDE